MRSAPDISVSPDGEERSMSDGQTKVFDPGEIEEDLQRLKTRFDEFRGRL